MAPSLLMRSMSVIFTALADLTRNITDILQLLSSLLDMEMEEEKEVVEEEVTLIRTTWTTNSKPSTYIQHKGEANNNKHSSGPWWTSQEERDSGDIFKYLK